MPFAWLDWTDELLPRARRERRAVLLFLTADWCGRCAAMESDVFADAAVQRALRENALPVKVDAGEHPHLDALYNQGGWPSTVLLGGDGDLLVGGTFFSASRLAALLAQAGAVCRGEARRDELDSTFPPATDLAPAAGAFPSDLLPAVEQALLADFDERHGGFGLGAKFPHVEVLDFALLRQAERFSPRLHELLEKTLAAMAGGALHDAVDGGFFRCCERRDWSAPQGGKCLETNAGLASVYLAAGQLLQRRDLLAVGESAAAALLRDFLDAQEGLFHSGLLPDSEYYALPAAARRTRRPPAPSGRFLADGNARAAELLLEAGAALGRPEWTALAVGVMRRVLARLLRPGRGVFHAWEDGRRLAPGRLRDQAAVGRALLALIQYTGDADFLAPLEELVEVLAARHVLPSGEFADAAERGPAAARSAEAQLRDGAAAAEVLLRAALLLGRGSLAELAHAALAPTARDFRRHGYALAPYARAVSLVLHPPLHLVVVGPAADARSAALLAAASAGYLPGRVVQRVDPEDHATLARLGLPGGERPTAYVLRAHDCAGRYVEPVSLRASLRAARSRRLAG